MNNSLIALSEATRHNTTNTLNPLLASLQVYYVKLQHFHWNLTGRHFLELHEKLEEMYQDAFAKIDETAERIRGMGHFPYHTMKDFIENSEISEQPEIGSETDMIAEVVSDLNTMVAQLRGAIEQLSNSADNYADEGTIDMLIGYIKDFEKQIWMLSAWLN